MEFGKNFQTYAQEQIGPVFLVFLGIIAIHFFIKKETGKFVGFFIFSLFVAVFVFYPEGIQTLAVDLFKKIFVGG